MVHSRIIGSGVLDPQISPNYIDGNQHISLDFFNSGYSKHKNIQDNVNVIH